ncbi:hypothetical protein [Pelagovum pacificum]|uniref:Uncharacterized protein n=1 Tax=Pelagovum pacificum TaxID=2588711 RepID=A0A5C5GG23_9RHOB|nr:hypothetical protein [Pelagovum pacificum]QQA43971.1 hypothetical protein I8N54_05165 [Pelagovum pacificum]TNY32901.1 hypothetical protein FHY64_06390 [Pelagovum pacificum]
MPHALFHHTATHLELTCTSCRHTATIWRINADAQLVLLYRHEFERRVVCSRCGSKWPWVKALPPERRGQNRFG